MYEYLNGIVKYKSEDYFVLDVNDIGYKIYCSSPLIDSIPLDESNKITIFTYLVVREDLLSLYGFKNREQLKMFELLLTVSGVGPKVAGLIVSNIEPSNFAMAVLSENISLISSVKGIGKKGAQRVILELKDKLKGVEFNIITKQTSDSTRVDFISSNKYNEACSALTVLGYSPKQASDAIGRIYSEEITVEEIIKLALRELM